MATKKTDTKITNSPERPSEKAGRKTSLCVSVRTLTAEGWKRCLAKKHMDKRAKTQSR